MIYEYNGCLVVYNSTENVDIRALQSMTYLLKGILEVTKDEKIDKITARNN